jgi:tRNA threonylcarbamoyl adenosine modification protein (Sua5/YciO/YrdC/YwlC family)
VSTLETALAELDAGRAVVIPTDTVYGLAVSLRAAGAVARLFDIKGRPRSKAIPVLGHDAAALEAVASFDERARTAARLWPGPLTIVLRRAPGFEVDLGGTGSTVAVRVPAHPIAEELLRLSGPLAVTSANISGEPPLTTAAAAEEVFGRTVTVLDGGACEGAPSTVVDLTGAAPRVLREGALGAAQLQELMS